MNVESSSVSGSQFGFIERSFAFLFSCRVYLRTACLGAVDRMLPTMDISVINLGASSLCVLRSMKTDAHFCN